MLPDKFESGTANSVGIAGLGAGIRHVMERGTGAIRRHEVALTERLLEGLGSIPGVTLYGPRDASRRTAVVSLTVEGMRVSEVGYALDEEHEILCRVGLHCAPAAHRTIGTFSEGTVRLAAGLTTDIADIEATISAVKEIAQK
jgi:selenocysteine lyase/cysteine desulfurase